MKHKCKFCDRASESKYSISAHQTYCKANPNRKDNSGKNNPNFGNKGKNNYTDLDWSQVPFEKLGSGKRRERLLEESNHKCSSCGYNKTRDCGSTILEIDHIDGNSKNNDKENLRVLCPNCHALTPTFRNWGNKGNKKRSSRNR